MLRFSLDHLDGIFWNIIYYIPTTIEIHRYKLFERHCLPAPLVTQISIHSIAFEVSVHLKRCTTESSPLTVNNPLSPIAHVAVDNLTQRLLPSASQTKLPFDT